MCARLSLVSILSLAMTACLPSMRGAQGSTSNTTSTPTSGAQASSQTGAQAAGFANGVVTPFLADRFRLTLPAGASVRARGHSIMAADTPDAQETRAVYDEGDQRLVVFAEPLNSIAPPDFLAALRTYYGEDAASRTFTELPATNDSIRRIRVAPLKLDVDDATFLEAVYLAFPDGTIASVSFYLNPKAVDQIEHYRSIVQTIESSVTTGPRTLDFSAKQVTFGPYSLNVPSGWTVTPTPGPDFDVWRIARVGPLGGSFASLGIYLGQHASLQRNQMELPTTSRPDRAGTLLGRRTTWTEYLVTRDQSSLYFAETIVRASNDGVVHVWLTTDTETDLASLRQLAEAIH